MDITHLKNELADVERKCAEARRAIQAEADRLGGLERNGLQFDVDGACSSTVPSIAPLAAGLADLVRRSSEAKHRLDVARRSQWSRVPYVQIVEAIVAGEQLEQDQIAVACRRAGKSAEAMARDLDFVRSALATERAALEAEVELVGAVDALGAERRAIGDKGRSLGLQPPFITGDVTGNVVTRHHKLQPLVEEHARNVARVAAIKAAVRNAPAVAARLASWRANGGKVRP
jgi:hypothetical protein